MTKVLLTVFLFLGVSSVGGARELDDESSITNRELKGTIILRVDKRTRKAEYVKTDTVMTSKEKAKNFAKTAKFRKVPASNIKSELDHDSGSSSWYFYNNNPYDGRYGRGDYNDGYYNRGYNPYCNYYGNNYQSYYSYSNYNYSYYYYGNCYWNRGYGCGYY